MPTEELSNQPPKNPTLEEVYAQACELRARISADMRYSMADLRLMNRLCEIVRVQVQIKEVLK